MIRRFRLSLLHLLPLALCLLALTTRADQPRLSVAANRDRIYLGESFILTIRVENADQDIGDIRFITPPEADIQSLGSQSQRQRFVESINGRFSQRLVVAREFSYRFTPTASGDCAVGPIETSVNGRPMRAAGPTVRVTGTEQQPYVRLRVVSDKETALVEDPFIITFEIVARQLPEPYKDHDPFHVERPAQLIIPWLDEYEPRPQGLLGPTVDEVLRPLVSAAARRNGRFAIPYGVDFFGSRTLSRLNLPREPATLDGHPAWRYHLTVTYMADREGSFTFGPAQLKGQVITGVRPNGVPEMRDILAIGPAATVRVVPPPDEGRPETFVGTIGTNLNASALLDAQTCNQGDPLRLTLDISGPITLSNLRPPVLSLLPDVASSFRVYDDAVRSEEIPNQPDGRRFIYTIRPLVAGTIEFPPLPISFYNKEAGAYQTVFTEPLPLRVEAVAEFDPAVIIGPSVQQGDEADIATFKLRTKEPAAIAATFDAAQYPRWTISRLLYWLLPAPLLTLVLWVLRGIYRRWHGWLASLRRYRAGGKAARHLRRARNSSAAWQIVARFFAERFDVPVAGFSPLDARSILQSYNLPQSLTSQITTLLEPLFDQAFRPDEPDHDLLEKVRRDLPDLLRRCSRLSHGQKEPRSSLLLLLALLTLPLTGNSQEQFRWNQANASLARAATPAEYAAAADLYRDLAEQGLRTAGVMRNYGTALLLAEAPEAAADALRRAEQYGGTSADLRHNLRLALTTHSHSDGTEQTGTSRAEQLSWARVPFFWHYRLPWQIRIQVLLFLYNLLWLAVVLRIARLRALARGLFAVALLGTVMFGSSVAVSAHFLSTPLPTPSYVWQTEEVEP